MRVGDFAYLGAGRDGGEDGGRECAGVAAERTKIVFVRYLLDYRGRRGLGAGHVGR